MCQYFPKSWLNMVFFWSLWSMNQTVSSGHHTWKWRFYLLSHVWLSVHGIIQARILEWVVMPVTKGSSQLGDRTQVSWITGEFFTIWATREAHLLSCKCWNYLRLMHEGISWELMKVYLFQEVTDLTWSQQWTFLKMCKIPDVTYFIQCKHI